MTVYLSGTITSDVRTQLWRTEAEKMLAEVGIQTLSPMRDKDPASLDRLGFRSNMASKLFVKRDKVDVEFCDAMLIYFPEGICPERQSIGTWTELGWADAAGKPIILVSDDPRIIAHPFVKELVTAVCGTLSEACEILKILA